MRRTSSSSSSSSSSSGSVSSTIPLTILSLRTVTTSAVACVFHGGAGYGPIQEIRKENDPAYMKWPVHINILWPFVPPSAATDTLVETTLQNTVRSFGSFIVGLERFETKNFRGYVYLQPRCSGTPLENLYSALASAFPQCDRKGKGYHPHLTVAKLEHESAAKRLSDQLQPKWKPCSFVVSEIVWLTRSGTEPFKVYRRFALEDSKTKGAEPKEKKEEKNVGDSAFYFQVAPWLGWFIELSLIPMVARPTPTLVFALDASGSMAETQRGGRCLWDEVQDVMRKIGKHRLDSARVLVYNQTTTSFTLSEFARASIDADGRTFFSSVLTQIASVIKSSRGKRLTFILMTDGQDTENRPAKLQDAITDIKTLTSAEGDQTSFHVIGFGPNVDEKFCLTLVNLGSIEGTFRYASQMADLDEKFFDLFDFSQSTISAELTIAGVSTPVVLTQSPDEKKKYDLGIYLPPDSLFSRIPWSIAKCQIKIEGKQHSYELRSAAPTNYQRMRAIDTISPQSAKEAADLYTEVGRIPQRASNIAESLALLDLRSRVRARLTEYVRLYNAAEEKKLDTDGQLKLQSMKHDHIFAKSSRNSRVEMRKALNLGEREKVYTELFGLHETLVATPKELEDLQRLEKEKKWQCALSLVGLHELMTQTMDDFLCLGVMVSRDELVVDNPTRGLNLVSVSATVLSFNTFLQFVEQSRDHKGAEATHGGFAKSTSAHCCVGVAREPINAVIPLFLHEQHHARVKARKRHWLGCLYMLDTDGYASAQEAAFLNLLAGVVTKTDVRTEFGKSMVHEIACVAWAVRNSTDFAKCPQAQQYAAFAREPQARTKKHYSALDVPLVMAFLEDYFSNKDAESKDEKKSVSALRTILRPVFYECIKRHVLDVYGANKIEAHRIAKRLLYGEHEKKEEKKEEGKKPKCVKLMEAEELFAEWFANPADHPQPSLDGVMSAAAQWVSESVMPLSERLILELMGRPPTWLVELAVKLFALLSMPCTPKEVETMLQPRTAEEWYEARVELVLDYFFYNDLPPQDASAGTPLEFVHSKFQGESKQRAESHQREEDAQQIATIIADCSSLDAFAGMLRVYCPTRNGPIWRFMIAEIVKREDAPKCAAILSNRVDAGQDALDEMQFLYDTDLKNSVWICPDRHIMQQMLRIVGPDEISRIEGHHAASGQYTGHVYRGGHDLKNRHGHSNDNPYKPLRRYFTTYVLL